ncbi:hypothetical protein ACE5IS_19380 [Leptospira wolffii]|uniref:Uncharacterized protein n=1 Tax=Leptospira wolffii TaxID=409998 RepID=A0ABV5BTR1_9LEPT
MFFSHLGGAEEALKKENVFRLIAISEGIVGSSYRTYSIKVAFTFTQWYTVIKKKKEDSSSVIFKIYFPSVFNLIIYIVLSIFGSNFLEATENSSNSQFLTETIFSVPLAGFFIFELEIGRDRISELHEKNRIGAIHGIK